MVMVFGSRITLMRIVTGMKDSIRMIARMASVSTNGKMELYMRVNL
jgi:hypothetical protein